jgi:hypothetical protein
MCWAQKRLGSIIIVVPVVPMTVVVPVPVLVRIIVVIVTAERKAWTNHGRKKFE